MTWLSCLRCLRKKVSLIIIAISPRSSSVPTTDPFTISEPRDPEVGHFYVVRKRQSADFKALKLFKGRCSFDCSLVFFKETTLERADFTLQLLMFVTAEKEKRMFKIFFLSSFCQLLSPRIQARTG